MRRVRLFGNINIRIGHIGMEKILGDVSDFFESHAFCKQSIFFCKIGFFFWKILVSDEKMCYHESKETVGGKVYEL